MWLLESLGKFIAGLFVDIAATVLTLLTSLMNGVTKMAIDNLKLLPKEFNKELYDLIKTTHTNVIIPLAILILAFIFTKEILDTFIDNNNLNTNLDSEVFFKWFFKVIISLFLISKSFEIMEGILAISRIFINNKNLEVKDIDFSIENIDEWKKSLVKNLSAGNAAVFAMGATIISGISIAKLVKVILIIFKRIFEMFFILCFGAIPFAMIMSKKYEIQTWNFLKRVFALTLQVAMFLLLIKMMNILWTSVVITEFKTTEGTLSSVILSLLKMLAYISCISISFEKVEEYSEKFLGLRG